MIWCRAAAVTDALEKAGDHVRFTVTADQPDPGHTVPRDHIWRDVLGQVITVPLRDAVVVVIGECLL
jgi:lysyl-tRNA synthetase class I